MKTDCPDCAGWGFELTAEERLSGRLNPYTEVGKTCSKCNGRGWIDNTGGLDVLMCPKCFGSGSVKGTSQ